MIAIIKGRGHGGIEANFAPEGFQHQPVLAIICAAMGDLHDITKACPKHEKSNFYMTKSSSCVLSSIEVNLPRSTMLEQGQVSTR